MKMSIYSAFIIEDRNLPEYRPNWMSAERYDYCDYYFDQSQDNTSSFKGLLATISSFFKSGNR